MGIAVFTRIPRGVQVGHHYSATVARLLGAIDIQVWWSLGDPNYRPRSYEEQGLLTRAVSREGCPKG